MSARPNGRKRYADVQPVRTERSPIGIVLVIVGTLFVVLAVAFSIGSHS